MKRALPNLALAGLTTVLLATACPSPSTAESGKPSTPDVINAHRIVDTNWGNVCSVDLRGRVACWGYDGFQVGLSQVPEDAGPAIDVQVGTAHACTLRLDHTVRCWGAPGSGGWPAHGQVDVPSDLGPVTQLSVGDYHSCALTVDGSVRCWGLGSTHGAGVALAYTPRPSEHIAAVAAGGQVTCVVLTSGAVRCSPSAGQLADVWAERTDIAVVSVAGRAPNTVLCGVTSGGRVECLGHGLFPTGQSDVPADLGPASDVEAGAFETCALLRTGGVRCWGWGESEATRVPQDLGAATSVTTDAGTACIATVREAVACWGSPYEIPAALRQGVPRPPTTLSATPGDRTAEVAWAPTPDDGGTAVQSYTVTASPGGAQCTSTGLSCVVSGLSNRQSYTFTATASNSVGISDPSKVSEPVTPLAPGFQMWPVDPVLAYGSSTTLRLAQAPFGGSIALTGSLKATLAADGAGWANSPYTAIKAGVQKFTAAYSVKVGKKTTKYSAATQVYVPAVAAPATRVKQGKTGKFSLQYMPAAAAVSIALSDGRTLTGVADSVGKATFTPTFTTLGTVSYTVTVAGVHIGTGGLTVTK